MAKYITRTNHLYGSRGAIIGKVSYDKLPADMQAVLKEASLAGEKHYNTLVELARVEHTKLILESGASIIEVDPTPFKEKVSAIVDTLENEGYWSKGLYQKIQEIE